MKKNNITIAIIFTLSLIMISCSSDKKNNELIGEFEFRTLHYIRLFKGLKKQKIGNDHFILGKGNLSIHKGKSSNEYVIDLNYTEPKTDKFSRKPGITYEKFNFEIKNIIETESSIQFIATAFMGAIKLNCKVFTNDGKKVLAIEKELVKKNHINSSLNPWFYKIDDKFVYYNLDIPISSEKEFYSKQVIYMKDSLKLEDIKTSKMKRLENGIKYLEKEYLN